MIFIVLDAIDVENDTKIAGHVIKMHQFRLNNEQIGEALLLGDNPINSFFNSANESSIYETDYKLSHASDSGNHSIQNEDNNAFTDLILSIEFLLKYIQVAKALKPSLTSKASNFISDEYSKLRTKDVYSNEVTKTQPVTARTLESIIRLATAHAKARISKKIEVIDVEQSLELVNYAYFKEFGIKKIPKGDVLDIICGSSMNVNPSDKMFSSSISLEQKQFKDKLLQFEQITFETFSSLHVESIPISQLLASLTDLSNELYTLEEVKKFLQIMEESNRLMVSGESIYLI